MTIPRSPVSLPMPSSAFHGFRRIPETPKRRTRNSGNRKTSMKPQPASLTVHRYPPLVQQRRRGSPMADAHAGGWNNYPARLLAVTEGRDPGPDLLAAERVASAPGRMSE